MNTILLLLMILGIPMIPYLILNRTWRGEQTVSRSRSNVLDRMAQPFLRMAAWMHMHHPHLLHR